MGVRGEGKFVIPAQAGIQEVSIAWILAYARMT